MSSATIPTSSYIFSVYYAYASATGVDIITLSKAAQHADMIVAVVSGAASIDQHFLATGASSTSASVPSFTPPVGSLVIAAIGSSSNQETFTSGSGYALDASEESIAVESLSPAITNTTSSFTLSGAAGWVEVSFSISGLSPPLLTPDMVPSAVSQTAVSGVQGVTITYTSETAGSLSISVYLSLTNPAGQMISVVKVASGAPISQGDSATFFFGLTGVAPGTYTGSLFASSLQGVAVSTVSTLQVTV
jgi:hypothetical protein